MTTTIALTSARQETRSIPRPHPVLRVMAWELRRFRASRLFWLQALAFFCLVLLVIWVQQMPQQFANSSRSTLTGMVTSFHSFLAGTSAWGLCQTLPTSALLLLAVLLPFVNADGVRRDLSRRTHELLMTTVVPTSAYVWVRYLIGLLISLGLALLMLAAILGMGLLLHLTVPAYPLPSTGAVLLLWVGMVVSATILLSSLSFVLGTLLPRQATLVKIVILLGWFAGAVILPPPAGIDNTSSVPAWYSMWDPTSAATALRMNAQYQVALNNLQALATSAAQMQNAILTVENRLPDLGTWFAPHLLLAGASLILVLVATLAFKRSRDTLS